MPEDALTDLERRMLDDLEWAETAPEVQQHDGKLVAVRGKRVIAVGTDQNALLAQAAAQERCPEEELVLVVVPRFWDSNSSSATNPC